MPRGYATVCRYPRFHLVLVWPLGSSGFRSGVGAKRRGRLRQGGTRAPGFRGSLGVHPKSGSFVRLLFLEVCDE